MTRIIRSLRRSYKLCDILEVLHFPKSTYMYWQKHLDEPDRDTDLKGRIQAIHKKQPNYGYRRIYGYLRKEGLKINIKKVRRIAGELHIQVTSFTRKSRKYSSYKGKIGKISPNRIHRRFNTSVPHQKITTDTSEFKYYEIDQKGNLIMHKLYLDPFLDMYNQEIISFGISKTPSASSVMTAVNKAIMVTSDCPFRRTFHSDRGWAYQMKAYVKALKDSHIFQSMSRKGNCYDNSVMENFFGLLKQEVYYGKTYYSFEALKKAIVKFIRYYNEERIKCRLGWMSPVEYRLASYSYNR